MPKMGERFHIQARGIHGPGVVAENGCIVFAGSEVRNHLAKYLAQGLIELRTKCMEGR